MLNCKKIFLLFFIALFFFLAFSASALDKNYDNDEIFKAQVTQILGQNNKTATDGLNFIQQKLKLNGLEGRWMNREIIFDGTQYQVISSPKYNVGDKVLVNASPKEDGQYNFYVIGFVRQTPLYWLAAIFALVVIMVGRLKGLRALIVLLLSFVIILKFIVPKILAGSNPLWISILGSLFILILAIYITEGLKRNSTIAIFSIFISLVITGVLSVWAVTITKLTGYAGEESMFLNGLAGGHINLKGLLLAGIIIGALGILDDVVISQVALIQELKSSNPQLPKKQIYAQGMKVGISHLSSMVNTLFLAYAGVALPLLILFSIKQAPFLTFNQIINNEIIATEIVRTLSGSIGLVLAVPIANLLATYFVKIKKTS